MAKKSKPSKAKPKKDTIVHHGHIREYNEKPETDLLSGCKMVIVATIQPADLPLSSKATSKDRTRRGELTITYPTFDDKAGPDEATFVVSGRYIQNYAHPLKAGDPGELKITIKTDETIALDVVTKLLELKRMKEHVKLSFSGGFEQKTLDIV